MAENDARDSPDWFPRVQLAKSLLDQRPANALTCELVVMALRGATIAQLHAYEKAAA